LAVILQLFHKNIFVLTYISSNFNLTQKNYNSAVAVLCLSTCICPVCKTCALIFYGYCFRNVFFIDRDAAQSWIRLKVHRVYCKKCRHTHALLPDICIPYSPFLLHDAARLLSSDHESHEEIMIDCPFLSQRRVQALKDAFTMHSPFTAEKLQDMHLSSLSDTLFIQYLHQHRNVRLFRLSGEKCRYT